MSESEFSKLTEELRQFTAERNWEKFHSPKNLSMAIAGEAGELVSELRWLTENESRKESLSPEKLHAIALEIADVQILLLQMAAALDLEIPVVVREKIEINKNRQWETDNN
jgi:NTP pyrophosphatase (non-canonical NTP hydrolase)